MKKYFFVWKYVGVSLVFMIGVAGCNSSTLVTQALPLGVQVAQATAGECQNGGQVIRTFRDQNANGAFEPEDQVVSETPVCNGPQGPVGPQGIQGQGGGLRVGTADVGSCPAGGLVLTTYLDSNNNSLLDFGEQVTSLSTLCNGINGEAGASAHLTVIAATALQCPAGGEVFFSSMDGGASEQAIVCNGISAHFESGAIGPAVVGKAYSACHHDYVYLPGTSSSRGWLVFRHQGNGALDQGIGATGFQVWTVDISDFLLSSEVGQVSYCQLHWDPGTLKLSYTVLDSRDGLQGLTGLIQL